MGFFSRLKTLLTGAGETTLDRLEDPGVVIAGKLAEAHSDYSKAMDALATCTATSKSLQRRSVEVGKDRDRWKKIALAATEQENVQDAQDAFTKFKTCELSFASLTEQIEALTLDIEFQTKLLAEFRDSILELESQRQSIVAQTELNKARANVQGVTKTGSIGSAQETVQRMHEKVLQERDRLDARASLEALPEDRFSKYEKPAMSLKEIQRELKK